MRHKRPRVSIGWREDRSQAFHDRTQPQGRCTRCFQPGHGSKECPNRQFKPGELDGKYCAQCADLCWRRPRVGKCACGKPWGPERIERPLPELASSFGRW